MKLTALFFAPILVVAAGCNTAQLSISAQIDSGPDTCDASVTFDTCDANAVEASTQCVEQLDAGISSGLYPVGCLATTHYFYPAGNYCATLTCNCAPTDGSVGRWACVGEGK